MSHFMIISGMPPSFDGLEPIYPVPVIDAQDYIRGLAAELEAEEGGSIHLVDDGETGTSDTFVADTVSAVQDKKPLEATVLWQLIARLVESGTTFRIWWANNDMQAYREAVLCRSKEEIHEQITKQSEAEFGKLQIRYTANLSLNTDAIRCPLAWRHGAC
ncbi:hypothetical protein Q8A64_02180 [Oxalobacteraceae bacterium R-40]|uniref:Uncharacterized protein n=1 Tax=Keguizhuia sedimenti TaxID=3064264 RepID=A0ABU1BK16_9BURK|nr:hypothetical protein [Oxalobacteraceae bacterium R-40]